MYFSKSVSISYIIRRTCELYMTLQHPASASYCGKILTPSSSVAEVARFSVQFGIQLIMLEVLCILSCVFFSVEFHPDILQQLKSEIMVRISGREFVIMSLIQSLAVLVMIAKKFSRTLSLCIKMWRWICFRYSLVIYSDLQQ